MNTLAQTHIQPRRREPKRRASKTKVLFICHNHPTLRPGGAEAYALELHRHLDGSRNYSSVFLAKGGPPLGRSGRQHLGTYVAPVDDRANEYFIYTDGYDYDWTFGTIRHDKELYTRHLRAFLDAIRPDIVHVHHTMFLGYDVLREIKNTLPLAPIVYTLHEFMPICNRQGQMVRTIGEDLCQKESPRRCHECFPEISPQTFFLRKRFIQSHLSLVDRFIAPSAFLGERYVEWGIPREKIRVEEYGRTIIASALPSEPRRYRDRFAFFGQTTPFKGLHVLLKAMETLAQDYPDPRSAPTHGSGSTTRRGGSRGPSPHLRVHAANLDLHPEGYQHRIKELLDRAASNVSVVGPYDHEQLPDLMAAIDWVVVPSTWWENSPLVIQEAFHFTRPVICSDIGGMAEKVRNEIDGLHFRVGDAASLARVLSRAATEPGLWERLRGEIRPVYAMDQHVAALGRIYDELFTERTARGG